MTGSRFSFVLWLVLCAAVQAAETSAPPGTARTPRLWPDYVGVTIPPNLAPLNFRILEPGDKFRVRLSGDRGTAIELSGDARVSIPARPWRALLEANAGASLRWDIAAREPGRGWVTYSTVTNSVAREPIDSHLVYRLLRPLYNMFSHVGIYQRDLTTFSQSVVLHNRSFGQGCVNCHTFLNHQPDTMLLQIRHPGSGNPMLIARSNTVAKVARTTGYASWHPSGRLLAYSANKLSLFFHTVGETRDVYDAESNLGIYRLDQNRVVIPPVLARPDRQETWPSWSPDGKFLYFSSAPVLPLSRFREVRYDLVRVPYDVDKDEWGAAETLVDARQTGLSAVQPRVSPDGRYLLFCQCEYGHFPIYQPSSDLYLMDLARGGIRRLDELNSPEADTWHCWSSNGRWIVFSSKRRDGLFARPHFSYFDASAHFSKPLLLPQEDPDFYDSFLRTFNVPELIQGPVTVPEADLAAGVLAPRQVWRPELATDGAPAQVMSPEVDTIQTEPYYQPRPKAGKP